MKDLPKPAFSTEEEILEGGEALMKAGDTTVENVEAAVPLGELVLDNDVVHVRYMRKDGDLLYHVFRGEEVPEKFWGAGQFGLVVLAAAEAAWPVDTPHVDFNAESVRKEAVNDDPTQPSKYPDHYYGSYLVAIKSIDAKPMPPDEERIGRFAHILESELRKEIAAWSNGG